MCLHRMKDEDKVTGKWRLSDPAGARIDRKSSTLLSHLVTIMLVVPSGMIPESFQGTVIDPLPILLPSSLSGQGAQT